MFHCNQSNSNNRKVLMKAGPGIGKTTLGKKVTWDWATVVFKDFSIIFFVSLKLVNPNDTIENATKQQNPELEGLGVSQQKLKALLNRYSSRILIILDGLDEHGLGQNGDVLKIIESQKLLGCPILISSRPHSTWDIEKYFPTIVRVEGFTEEEARKFVSNFFTDENKIQQIMGFQPSDSREDFPVHKCPILLSILCFLVNKKEVDLSDTSITIGDMYFKMVKCLDKNYTIKKGISYQESDLIKVMKSVGQLALRTLLSDNPLLQRCEVLRIAGDFVLDYGFLAGHRDFTDLTADLYVTYAHRSLEEFFGSFGFLQALADGNRVDDILGSDCEKPILMVNPLVLRFCLWLLTQNCFDFPQNIYQKLVSFAAKRIDFRLLDLLAIERVYPAIGICDALLDTDSLKLKFLKDVLKKCQYIRALDIKNGEDEMSNFEHVDRVLGLMSSNLLSKLECLSVTGRYTFPSPHRDPLAISINPTDPDTFHKYLNVLLPKYDLLKRNPQVYATVECPESYDLSTLTTTYLKKLHLLREYTMERDSHVTLFSSGKFPHCPQLTHFTLQDCHIDDSVPFSFTNAVQNRQLSNLKRIELKSCIVVSDCEWPEVPEFCFETRGMLDSSQIQKLLLKFTELTVYESSLCVINIPVPLGNLSVLRLYDIDDHNLLQINDILKMEKLPNLTELHILGRCLTTFSVTSELEHIYSVKLYNLLDWFDPHKTVKLEKLALKSFITSAEGLEILSKKLAAIRLTELDLFGSSSFTGSLSAIFTHSFPRLNNLKLYQCKLNANDLQSLARANVEGKLPELRHLYISLNFDVRISDLFTHSAQWNQLTTLATSDLNAVNVESECLTSLEELILWWPRSQLPSVTRRWPSLKVIKVNDTDIVGCIADGIERGMFPALTTVRYDSVHLGRLFFFKLLKANISVEPTY